MSEIVIISSQPFEAYASVEQADLYFLAATHAANWVAASADNKAKALVTATRVLDRQRWRGDKYATTGQALAWPRTGVGVEGVENGVIPDQIATATMELALSLLDGAEVQTEQNTSQKIQSLSAGSVSLTFFRGAEGAPLRFPLIVQELVRDLLRGGSLMFTGLASGTDGVSVTATPPSLTGPL